jgi:hypothetical protein
MKQDQHIIPQVYLKQFGYQTKDGVWKVPTFNTEELDLMNRIDKTLIRQSNIKSLLTEVNIYDLTIGDKEIKMLEDFFQLTEDNYPKAIEEINRPRNLSLNNKDILVGFVSLLFVRTMDYRRILDLAIKRKDLTYLNGVFNNNSKRVKYILNLPIETAINFLIAFSGGYISNCLQNFKLSIIKSIPEEKWATTDNPVLVKCKAFDRVKLDFMGIDTKLICPLTPDYLAYIDHKDSNIRIYEGLDELEENKINEVSRSTFEKIWYDLTDKSRITKYLIVPTERKKETTTNKVDNDNTD